MELKISIQEIHIHIDGSALPTQQATADWKEILLQAVKDADHVSIHQPDADKIAPNDNKLADSAKKIADNAIVHESKAATGIKICEQCKKEYKPTSNAQRRCPECAGKKKDVTPEPKELSSQGRPLNICKECGQKFEPVKSTLEKFCSPLCKKYYTTKYNREWYQNKAKKTETSGNKTEPIVKKIETDIPKIEKPARIIPSGMSGEELQAMKDKERKPE